MNLQALIAALFTIIVWASLALLADRVSHIPPLLSAGLALMVGGLTTAWQRGAWQASGRLYLLGVGGLFGYHTLLFAAFGLAPSVQVNLLQYLWPLLIVLLSPVFLAGLRLSAYQLLGALMGCGGAALILGGARVTLSPEHALGYACAVAAAFVWATYSLGCRRLPPFPTSAIGACCLVAGVFSVALHLAIFGTHAVQVLTRDDLLLVAGLGLGPMGVAFLTWDIALKHGDPRSVAALAYLTPLLSTVLLTQVNGHSFSQQTGFAAGMILVGAILGNLRSLPRFGQRR